MGPSSSASKSMQGVLSESLFSALSLVCNMAEHFEGQEASKPALLWYPELRLKSLASVFRPARWHLGYEGLLMAQFEREPG